VPKILNDACLPPADLRSHIGQQPGDTEFKHAVSNRSTEAVITALWTEASLTLPTFDATHEGYEAYVPFDAVRRTLFAAHESAHHRIEQADVQFNSRVPSVKNVFVSFDGLNPEKTAARDH